MGDPVFHLQHQIEPLLAEPGEGGPVLGRAAVNLRQSAPQPGVLPLEEVQLCNRIKQIAGHSYRCLALLAARASPCLKGWVAPHGAA